MISIEYVTINDKLICNIKLEKAEINMNIFIDIWGDFIDMLKVKVYESLQESVQFFF